METVKVAFLSEDYFALADSRPELAAAFALGQSVIAISDRVAYEVVPSGASTGSVEIPPTYTPQPYPIGPQSTPPVLPTPVGEPTPPSQPAPGMLPCASGLLAPLPLVVGFLAFRSWWKRAKN